LLLSLTDGLETNLDNSGLPFAPAGDDFTGAFQWSTTLGVGERGSFFTQFGSDVVLADPDISAIPEPSTGLPACLGLLGLSACRPWVARIVKSDLTPDAEPDIDVGHRICPSVRGPMQALHSDQSRTRARTLRNSPANARSSGKLR
jgi:hypothetical protein